MYAFSFCLQLSASFVERFRPKVLRSCPVAMYEYLLFVFGVRVDLDEFRFNARLLQQLLLLLLPAGILQYGYSATA